MSENVRGPITDHVLTYACDKCREVSPTVVPQKRVRQFTKRYCNSIDIKLVCSYFKIRNVWCERPHPSWAPYVCGLQVFLCAGCDACYVGKTSLIFRTEDDRRTVETCF